MTTPPRMIHAVFVQTGDYAEAQERLARGGDETYYGQRRSIEFTSSLRTRCGNLSIICTRADFPLRTLSDGAQTVGVALHKQGTPRDVIARLDTLAPTSIILRQPLREVLSWAIARRVPILPTFADSFPLHGFKARYRNWRLARLLNHPHVEVVTNHHVNACRNLAAIGVHEHKLIPWDFTPSVTPELFSARTAPPSGPVKLVWIGPRHTPAKGLRDVCDAMNLLVQRSPGAMLTIIGGTQPDDDALRALTPAARQHVNCTGRIAHSAVIQAMRESDAVVVPSRHEYPEGLPFVIFDAFATRTPVIASDHPMFVGRVVHEQSGLVFPAGDPAALARCVERLSREPELLPRLSEHTKAAWERMQVPLKWEELVETWLLGPLSSEFVSRHGLRAFEGR